MWSDYYQGHYNWCLSTNADINQQFKQRRIAIDQCVAASDQACRKYANDAIQQVNAFVHKGCLVGSGNPSLWDNNPQDHYNWCRNNVGADLNQQHKLRRLATDNCQTVAFSISVSKPSPNTFQVSGSNFLPNHQINIRASDAALHSVNYPLPGAAAITTDSSGKFNASLGGVCRSPGVIYFVATDNRTGVGGVLWSQPSASQC